MIKVEIGKCIKPWWYTDIFNVGEYYPIIPDRNDGTPRAFINSYQGVRIEHGKLIRRAGIFHHSYFEPVKTIFLNNKKEVAEFKKEFFAKDSKYLQDLE